MTTESSQEYVNEQFRLADEALSDARYLLNGNRLKAGANRAYYAMFHAAQAALSHVNVRAPKTHVGTINLLGRHIIKTGKMDKRFSKDLQDAFDLRQQTDYQIHVNIGEAEVRDTVERAKDFVAEVKRVIGI